MSKAPQIQAALPILAWAHPDGRVVPAATMDSAQRDGGAMASSLAVHTIPCVAKKHVSEATVLTLAETFDLVVASGGEYHASRLSDADLRPRLLAFAQALGVHLVDGAQGVSKG